MSENIRTAGRILFSSSLLIILGFALGPVDSEPLATGWDKADHLLAFAVLTLLGQFAFPAKKWQALAAGLLLYGGLIEALQYFTPDRSASWLDLLADGLGISLGVALLAIRRKKNLVGTDGFEPPTSSL